VSGQTLKIGTRKSVMALAQTSLAIPPGIGAAFARDGLTHPRTKKKKSSGTGWSSLSGKIQHPIDRRPAETRYMHAVFSRSCVRYIQIATLH
jgi:hypothetical protein